MSAIFYVIERLEFYKGTGSKNIRFILAARIPEYNLLFKNRLIDIEQEKHRESIKKLNDPSFKYELPFFLQEEIKEFISNYVELSAGEEKSLDKYSEEIYKETKGHPIMVKFSVFGKGLRNDVEKRYVNYLIDRKNQTPDSLKIQTMLVCSLLDIAGLQINDNLLENMKLKKYAKTLRYALLYNYPDGMWKTIHPRWDIELLSFLYDAEENDIDERLEFLKNAIQSIFSLKDEKISVAIIETMYNISASIIEGVNKIPIDVVEDVIQQSQILDYLSEGIRSTLYAHIAFDYIDLERYDTALDKSNKALKINPNNIHALIGIGSYQDHTDKYDEAIQYYDKAIEIDPKHSTAWNNKGLALYHLSRYGEAIVCHEKAIDLDLNNDAAWDNIGLSLDSLGKYDEAIQYYDKAIELNPKQKYAWTNKGYTLDNLKKYDEAIACFDKAIEIDPKHKYAWNGKGGALYNLKKYDEAIACFDKVIEIDPKNDSAWNNKANALYALRNYDAAIKHYDKAIEIDPKFATAWNGKGYTLNNLKKYDEAIACFDKAIELNPKHKYDWNGKGGALYNLKKYDEAIACFDKAIERDPDYITAIENKRSALALPRLLPSAIT